MPDTSCRLKEGDALKVHLLKIIAHTIESRGLTQAQAASLLGTTQPEISKIKKQTHARFKVERLFDFLNSLDISVDIYISIAKEKAHQKVTSLL